MFSDHLVLATALCSKKGCKYQCLDPINILNAKFPDSYDDGKLKEVSKLITGRTTQRNGELIL